MIQEEEITMNISVIGHSSTGRRSIIESFEFNKLFDRNQLSNFPISFYRHHLTIDEVSLKLIIWLPIPRTPLDFYRTIPRFPDDISLIRSSTGILLVFDITKRDTFDDLDNFLKVVSDFCEKVVSIVLVGNMIDKEEDRQVSYEEAEAYGKRNNIRYIEVSALENKNINEAFEMMAREIIKRKKVNFSFKDFQETKVLEFRNNDHKQNRSYCC